MCNVIVGKLTGHKWKKIDVTLSCGMSLESSCRGVLCVGFVECKRVRLTGGSILRSVKCIFRLVSMLQRARPGGFGSDVNVRIVDFLFVVFEFFFTWVLFFFFLQLEGSNTRWHLCYDHKV